MYTFDPEDLQKSYLERQKSHQLFCNLVETKITNAIQEIKPKPEIKSRIKTSESFIFKAIANNCQQPLTEIKDQIGLRIIVAYEENIRQVDEIIQKEFGPCTREDKVHSLDPNQLGYLGIHYNDIKLSATKAEEKQYSDYSESVCEIQLRTNAQNAWAIVAHELSYKPSEKPPIDVQRSIYRLVALIELFDKEVSNAQNAIFENTTNYPEARLLRYLENSICLFSSKKSDKNFSLKNLSFLKQSLTQEEIENFESLIENFVARNRIKLRIIFENYQKDERSSYKISMLFQPESLLVFERLDRNTRYDLLDLWEKHLPIELLEFLSTEVWGANLPI